MRLAVAEALRMMYEVATILELPLYSPVWDRC